MYLHTFASFCLWRHIYTYSLEAPCIPVCKELLHPCSDQRNTLVWIRLNLYYQSSIGRTIRLFPAPGYYKPGCIDNLVHIWFPIYINWENLWKWNARAKGMWSAVLIDIAKPPSFEVRPVPAYTVSVCKTCSLPSSAQCLILNRLFDNSPCS